MIGRSPNLPATTEVTSGSHSRGSLTIPRCKIGTRPWPGQPELTLRIHYAQVTKSRASSSRNGPKSRNFHPKVEFSDSKSRKTQELHSHISVQLDVNYTFFTPQYRLPTPPQPSQHTKGQTQAQIILKNSHLSKYHVHTVQRFRILHPTFI